MMDFRDKGLGVIFEQGDQVWFADNHDTVLRYGTIVEVVDGYGPFGIAHIQSGEDPITRVFGFDDLARWKRT